MKNIFARFLAIVLVSLLPLGAQATTLSQFNTGNAISLTTDTPVVVRAGTSTSSVTVGTGTKSFTTQSGLGFVTGQPIRAVETSNSANSMQGTVSTYSGTSLVISVAQSTGSGTLTDWTIYGDVLVTPTNGTVTSASVATAHGFSGSVASATTTPVFTLSTACNGICKGDGTSISTATAGTDYQGALTLTTTGSSGAATLIGNTLNIPQYTGGGGGSFSISLGTGLTITPGIANASPLTQASTNLVPQTVVNTYTGTHTITAAETAGLDVCNSTTPMTLNLPQAGSTGFPVSSSISFINANTGNCSLATTTSVFNGMALTGGNIVLSQYGYATCAADSLGNWDCEGSPGGVQVATTITSNSSAAFAVGANGSSNPVLNIDASTAGAVTGINIKGAATGGTTTMSVTDTGSNSTLTISAKGSAPLNLTSGASGPVNLQTNGVTNFLVNSSGASFSPPRFNNNSGAHLLYSAPNDTSTTTSTEINQEYFNNGSGGAHQHAAGALTLNRDFRISSATHSFVGASTATDLATFGLDLPGCGTNATCTNVSGIYHASTALTATGTITNSYAINVASDTGATNNYAAKLSGDVLLSGSAPTLSSCGGGTLTSGSGDNKGSITGISAATACTITFANPLSSAPACTFSDSAGTAVGISSISTSAVTATMTALTGSLYYICF